MIVQGSDDRNDSKVGIEKLSSGIINNRVPLTNLARNVEAGVFYSKSTQSRNGPFSRD